MGGRRDFPGFCDDSFPEVFGLKAMPPQPDVLKPGQLPEEQIRSYFEKGYLLVPDFFQKEELDACRKDIEALVDRLAKMLYNGGKIKNLYEEKGLFERLTFIEQEYPGATVVFLKQGILPKSFSDVWASERLLNLMEQLIGPEIIGNPIWNLRCKTPSNEATTVPWHQDVGYLDNDSYSVLQPTAWIPFLDTNEQNGCMEVLEGGHATGKVARHTCCWRSTWYVELDEEDMEETLKVKVEDKVLCPVPYGGMLLINNLIPHRSLNNLSQEIRWSMDLRWQRADKPVGFYGIKEGVLMRSKKTPVTAVDWDTFSGLERHKAFADNIKVKEDLFDATIIGPWMKKWEMTHTNQHTAKFLEGSV